jgi:6-phosphogluconolactonase/glucosamine-6-phosphate isomerase/deaminase
VAQDPDQVSTDRISILATGAGGAAHVADRFAAAGRTAHARDGRFTVAVSPDALTDPIVDALARPPTAAQAFWRETHLFWTDTCFSGCDAPRSRARERASRLPVPATGLHLDVADRPDPLRAAEAYEQALRAFFGLRTGGIPRFDLIVLAIDEMGRIAGLRPGGPALDEIARLVVADFAPATGHCVVTITPPVLTRATAVLATSGLGTTEAVRALLFSAGPDVRRSPVQLLRAAEGEVAIVLGSTPDRSALSPQFDADPQRRVNC